MTVTSPPRSNRSVSGNVSPCTKSVRSANNARWLFPGSRVIVALAGMTIPSGTGTVAARPWTRKARRVPTYCATGVLPLSRRSSLSPSFRIESETGTPSGISQVGGLAGKATRGRAGTSVPGRATVSRGPLIATNATTSRNTAPITANRGTPLTDQVPLLGVARRQHRCPSLASSGRWSGYLPPARCPQSAQCRPDQDVRKAGARRD